MKIVKCKFSISTQYIKSEYSQVVNVEVEDDSTESEIEEQIEEAYREWLNNNNYGGWSIVE